MIDRLQSMNKAYDAKAYGVYQLQKGTPFVGNYSSNISMW